MPSPHSTLLTHIVPTVPNKKIYVSTLHILKVYLSAPAPLVCFPFVGIYHSSAETQQAHSLFLRRFTPLEMYYISKPSLTYRQARASLKQYKVQW